MTTRSARPPVPPPLRSPPPPDCTRRRWLLPTPQRIAVFSLPSLLPVYRASSLLVAAGETNAPGAQALGVVLFCPTAGNRIGWRLFIPPSVFCPKSGLLYLLIAIFLHKSGVIDKNGPRYGDRGPFLPWTGQRAHARIGPPWLDPMVATARSASGSPTRRPVRRAWQLRSPTLAFVTL